MLTWYEIHTKRKTPIKKEEKVTPIEDDGCVISEEDLEAIKERQEKVRQKQINEAIKIKRMELRHQEERQLKEKEVNFFTKCLFRSMKDLTYEQMRDQTAQMVQNPSFIEQLSEVYKNSSAADYDDTTCKIIVTKALHKIIEYCAREVELSHKELPQVETQKTLRF